MVIPNAILKTANVCHQIQEDTGTCYEIVYISIFYFIGFPIKEKIGN